MLSVPFFPHLLSSSLTDGSRLLIVNPPVEALAWRRCAHVFLVARVYQCVVPALFSVLMESFGLELEISSLLHLPSSDHLFGEEDIGDVDEKWWEELCLASPSRDVEEQTKEAPDGDDGSITAHAPTSSSHSSHTPTTTFNPGVTVGASSLEVAGSKRSGVSSPETNQDDPKRVRRLEKNREAASQSRARKKSYVKELEAKCRMLEAHVAQIQRSMTVTSMENSALKDELVRLKKPKDGVKSGVTEPAVLESNSLPSEFLCHRSCHHHMGQYPTSRTAGLFQGFLLALLQLLMLVAVNGPSDHQASPPQSLREGRIRLPVGMELYRGVHGIEGGMAAGRIFKKKKGRPRHTSNSWYASRSSERRLVGRTRRRVKHLRSSRIL